ncbi:glycosyltransferase [Rhodococcus sp. ARC_M5]|nr:glycosyltransferase [Rhodococcus sp. ARC_M5]MCJ0892078.1 glycosyltransferase [Rhodococcus sp. ARC_M5]
MGRIAEWKGQEFAIQAFANLVKTTPAKLTLIGGALFEDAAYLERLKSVIADLGLSSNVHLTGHVNDVYAALESVDAVIHTSIIPEPFGQVIVQAMAMGLPVLASGEGGPLETITDGRDGLFFEPRDVQSLTDGMMRLVKDPVLRSRLGAAAVETARHYSPENLVAKFEGFLLDS